MTLLIAQISDLHVRPRGHAANRVVETNMFLDRALARIARHDPLPDAVIATGDLVDEGLVSEYELLNEMLARLPVPVYPVLGNHDDRAAFREVFSDGPWPADGPVRYAVDIGPLRLVVLDSLVPGKSHGRLAAADLDWLDAELAADDRPVIVAIHHPPLACGIASMDRTMLRNGAEFGAVIARHRNVARVIAGHNHRPITAAFAGTILTVAPSTAHQVTLDLADSGHGSFLFEPPAFFLHLWSEVSGLVTHMGYVERFDGPYPFHPDKRHPWR